MPTIHLDTIIEAPPSAVFGVLTDWHKNPLWERELRQYTLMTPEPFGVGTRLHWVRQVGGRRISGIQDITECIPPRLLASEVPTGPIRFRTLTRLEPTAGGAHTTVSAELTVIPRGLLRILTPLLARNVRRQATGNLNTLKELIEKDAGARAPS
jgi:uncharacterized protein YndB with AHSA1/START domain